MRRVVQNQHTIYCNHICHIQPRQKYYDNTRNIVSIIAVIIFYISNSLQLILVLHHCKSQINENVPTETCFKIPSINSTSLGKLFIGYVIIIMLWDTYIYDDMTHESSGCVIISIHNHTPSIHPSILTTNTAVCDNTVKGTRFGSLPTPPISTRKRRSPVLFCGGHMEESTALQFTFKRVSKLSPPWVS